MYDAKLFGGTCCNSHGKGRFSLSRYVGLVKKAKESWEPEGNVPPLLHDRFAKGEGKKDGDSVGLCKNVWCDKYMIIPSDERPSHKKVCKLEAVPVY